MFSFLIATLVPTLIFTGVALKRPISFDGGMNLQVSQNIVEKGEYSRSYAYASSTKEEIKNNNRLFPSEVETNGPYIIAGAVGIAVFGQSQLGFQFANLLFIFGTAAIVWWMLRRWLIVATTATPLVLLLLPNSYDTALGGYGEVPALFFAILSIALLSHAVSLSNKSKSLKFLAFSLLSAGAAIVTKTYLIGFLPALMVGIILFKYAKKLRWRSLLSRLPFLAVIPLLYETWHLINLASVQEYWVWLKQQLKPILIQSGLWKPSDRPEVVDRTMSLHEKIGSQLDIFINQVGIFPIIIFSALAVSLIVIIVYSRMKPVSLGQIWCLVRTRNGILAIVLFTMFATYFVWWLILLPESKTFIRRTLPTMLPLSILLSLLIAISGNLLFSTSKKISTRNLVAGRALLICTLVILGVSLLPTAHSLVKSYDKKPYVTIQNYEDTVSKLRKVAGGGEIYGANWWSTPVVGLMSGRDIRNVELINICKGIKKDDVFVWDKIAIGVTKKPDPISRNVKYTLIVETDAANLYRITPKKGYCEGK